MRLRLLLGLLLLLLLLTLLLWICWLLLIHLYLLWPIIVIPRLLKALDFIVVVVVNVFFLWPCFLLLVILYLVVVNEFWSEAPEFYLWVCVVGLRSPTQLQCWGWVELWCCWGCDNRLAGFPLITRKCSYQIRGNPLDQGGCTFLSDNLTWKTKRRKASLEINKYMWIPHDKGRSSWFLLLYFSLLWEIPKSESNLTVENNKNSDI